MLLAIRPSRHLPHAHEPAADKGDKAKAQKGWAGLKSRANAFVRLANQRMPEESTPLSEVK